MSFSESYFVIQEHKHVMYKDRNSKFLAFAFYVENEMDVKQNLIVLKKEHPSANHHCYAWQLGTVNVSQRANDDGEPSSSAGKPILTQIQSRNLTNCLIVVVRYFGGTLLGVNGLINAYKQAASDVIKECTLVEKFILAEYSVEFNFESTSAVMRILKNNGAKLISQDYDTVNSIIFNVKKVQRQNLEQQFKELFTCKLTYIKTY
ncbi:MAG: YigZ family protein [Bacteroidota bacterium]|nr:YigZ family protein [Bacteroidota bacterium]